MANPALKNNLNYNKLFSLVLIDSNQSQTPILTARKMKKAVGTAKKQLKSSSKTSIGATKIFPRFAPTTTCRLFGSGPGRYGWNLWAWSWTTMRGCGRIRWLVWRKWKPGSIIRNSRRRSRELRKWKRSENYDFRMFFSRVNFCLERIVSGVKIFF